MTPGAHAACAACGGIDWAAATHAGCLQAAGAQQREAGLLAHTPETLDAWGRMLRTRVHGHPLALGLERTQGPLVSAWRTYDFLGLLPLQPLTVARDRAACTPSRATDDPTDAALQLARLRTPRDTLQPLQPPRPPRRALAQLGAHRRRVVGETVRLTPRLPRTLQHSFPQGLHGLQAKATRILWDVLRRWPTRKAAPRARHPGHLLSRPPWALCGRPRHASPRSQGRQALDHRGGRHRPPGPARPDPRQPAPCRLARPRGLGHRQRPARPAPSRLALLPGPARGRTWLRCPPPGGLGRATRTLCHRCRTPPIGRDRTRAGAPRQNIGGPLAPPVPDLPPPHVWGVGGGIAPACLLGPGLFPAATRHGESPSGRRAGPGVHMDASALSVWARAHPLRCVSLSPGAQSPWFISTPTSCQSSCAFLCRVLLCKRGFLCKAS